MFACEAYILLFTLAIINTVIANIVEGDQFRHTCTGGLSIVDVETNTVIHKINETSMDIIISLSEDKEVEVTQTGNCCHQVFSDRNCRGEVTSIKNNVKHRMKHRGRMSVVKSDTANGSCRSFRNIKNTNICKIKIQYDKKQVQEDGDSNESLTNKPDINNIETTQDTATINNKSDNVDSSVTDSNDYESASPENIDTNRHINNDLLDNAEPQVNVVTTTNRNNEREVVTSPVQFKKNTPSSVTAICVPFIIVIILSILFGLFYKRNNIQSCFYRNISPQNDWSPVYNDDFAIDMEDSDDRSIIKTKKVINKTNIDYELATSNDICG